ncbi:MAG: carboxypeptidase-like regulatory domain-containing protein, partial [Thermoanaerobaculia bacterium]
MRRVFGVVLLAAALPAAAAITGFVVDSSGAPIATARVDAYRAVPQYFAMMLIRKSAELHPIASAKTDAKGTFALDLAGHGVADIQVSADGYAPADVFAAYDDNVGTITLSSATNVEGKAVANGKPVADAAVIAYPAEGMPTITKTNAQGGFRLPDPKPWAQYVIVAHPDFAWVAHPPANLNFVLEAGRDVKGKVLDAKGAPVAGADVNVDNISFAKTGEDGSFIVKHVPARSNVITARTTTGASSMRLPSGAPTLKLRPVAHVKGVVRDSSKQPLAGLAVMIGAEEAGGFDVAYTDAKGAFDLSAARAKYNLTADGFGVYEIENAEIDGRAGDIRQDLVAQRQRYVEGVVKKSDGSVVQGALLGTSEQDGSAQMQVVPTAVMTAVRTGADGRFRIPSAGMTNFRIVALKSGLPPAESAPITDATTDRAIVITVPDGVEIRGTVVDADSKPISGVSINPIIGYGAERMLNAEGERQDEAAWTTTKDDGTFIGRLNPGSLALNFARKGFVATQQMIEVAPSMRPIAVTLTKGVALRGRVARADGTPAPEIPVGVGERYVMSEADGSFAIEDIETGDYVLRFGATGTQQKNVHAPAEDIRLVLAGTRKITGRVTDSATGAPVEQFFVWVRGEKDQVPPESVASPTGEFSIDAPETAVKLNVSASGYAPAKDIAVAVSPAAPVAVSLSRGRSIRGRVADASDQPLGEVEIARTSGDYDFTGERSLHSNPDGTWEIGGIGFDDEVALSFTKEGFVTEQRKLRPGHEDAKLDVTMRHGIVVSGRVIDSSGNGVADISVGASSAAHGAGYESASTDKTGA